MTTGARTSLLCEGHSWPNAIHFYLWPDAKNVNLRNSITTNFKSETYHGESKILATYDSSHLSRFSSSKVEANLDHLHTFESPVYVLENSLPSGKYQNKCIYRSRIGIYLSRSPCRVSNVTLLLNTQIVNMLPQFHYIYDIESDTYKIDGNFKSLWQHKSKLVREKIERSEIDALPTKPHDSRNDVLLPDAIDPLPMFST